MSEGGKWKAVLGLGCISHREASLSKDLEEVRPGMGPAGVWEEQCGPRARR